VNQPVHYQLALVTPGICPRWAKFLKQIRQIPNLLNNPRERPQRLQRFFARVENFGSRFNLSSQLFFAILCSF